MLVRKVIDLNAPLILTPEQKAELDMLADIKDEDIVFDEDCPPQTDEQLKQFKRVHPRRKEKTAS
ncbi:MAG: hypothetical protein IKZ53_05455 [Selenomonadaceae bacterium]|nr:hypothetical protein [Selenomonadaceae bacterium]